LNILSGYKTSKINGSITMNGRERNISVFRKLSAYIMQDNQLHLNLTVEEAMNVATNLKLSQKVNSIEKWNVVSFTNVYLNFDVIHNHITKSLNLNKDKRNSRNTWTRRTQKNFDSQFIRRTKKAFINCFGTCQ
jgi:ATP-binding cassette, subfamily G (WHITE), member 1